MDTIINGLAIVGAGTLVILIGLGIFVIVKVIQELT